MAQPSLTPTEFSSAVTAITAAFGDPTTGGEPGQIGLAAAIGVLMLVIIGIVSVFGVRFTNSRQTEY